ncbi:unnamed protein product [Brassica oleracea]
MLNIIETSQDVFIMIKKTGKFQPTSDLNELREKLVPRI